MTHHCRRSIATRFSSAKKHTKTVRSARDKRYARKAAPPQKTPLPGPPAKTEQRQPEPKAEQQAAPKEQTPENSKEHSFEDRLAAFAQRYDLTPRECDAVALVVCSEDALKQLAEAMGVSLRTLQKHLTSIYKKTDTQSRAGLTKLFWE